MKNKSTRLIDDLRQKDRFTQLVDDLMEGKLTLTQVQIAIRTYVRYSEDIPEEVKDLLAGKEHSTGLIYIMFRPIQEVIGAMELAFRRGKDWNERAD